MDWKAILTNIAPTIANVLGGPLAGTAVTSLEGALGLNKVSDNINDRTASVSTALANATPEQLIAIKQADSDLATKLAALVVQDRSSARDREVKVQDWTPRILAYLIVLASTGMAYGILFHKMAADSATIGMIVGYLFRESTSIFEYYFGGSQAMDNASANFVINK